MSCTASVAGVLDNQSVVRHEGRIGGVLKYTCYLSAEKKTSFSDGANGDDGTLSTIQEKERTKERERERLKRESN